MKKTVWILITLFSLFSMAAMPVHQDGSLEVSPTSSEKSELPNTVVTYSLKVTNTTGSEQTVDVNVSAGAQGWNAWASASKLTIANGESQTVTISVAIKADAGLGDFDTTTVNFADGNGHTASASLTTRAVPPPPTPTPTLAPTARPTIPPALNRPLVIISGYKGASNIGPGDDFTLDVTFRNNGQTEAINLVFTFSSENFLMRSTGGVRTIASLDGGSSVRVTQPMTGASTLSGLTAGTVTVKAAYNDANGEAYNESFTLTINAKEATPTPAWSGSGWSTATPTQAARSQLVVTSYQPSVDPLQPGTIFDLDIEIHNTGSADARAVSMILGGGATVDSSSGTPVPGSASGGSSDLTNFAPLGTSNLMALGDIPKGGSLKVKTRLIVNVSTVPGAYPLKLSFAYSDAKNNQQIDNQVITLLVYALPQVEVVFYRDPGMLMVGQPGALPIQITNLGRKNTVLGSMKVTSDQAEVTNNVIQVGNIDPGGYFTLDAMAIPNAAGPVTLNITINYNDDFNQLRTITQTLKIMAEEGQPEPGMQQPGPDGQMPPDGSAPADESFWGKVVRLVKGLFGLDSAPPETAPTPQDMPPDGGKPMPGGGGG